MSTRQTKGQVEAQIAAMITGFEREQMGRGPKEVRVWIVEDLILIRLKGVLTPAEERLTGDPNGRHLLKQLRNRLIETSRAVGHRLLTRDDVPLERRSHSHLEDDWPGDEVGQVVHAVEVLADLLGRCARALELSSNMLEELIYLPCGERFQPVRHHLRIEGSN